MKKINIKYSSLIISIFMSLSLLLTACDNNDNTSKVDNNQSSVTDSKDESSKQEKFEDESYITDIDWLEENLENEDLLILDARGEKDYKKGHIPGAIHVTWQQFSNMEGKPGDEKWGTILESEELSKELSEVGITKDKDVVVYCDTQNGWGEDGRLVWMLRRAGFEKPVMLDGGFNYWKSNGNEVSKEEVKPTPSTVEISSLDSNTNITTEELSKDLGQVKLIDTRAKKEYDGATDYGEPRGGHIPGAVNIDFLEFLNEDGTLKRPTEIEKILKENHISKDEKIVTYCTAGIRSAHMQIVLDMMGYKNARNYDQSFNGWAGDENLEVEK